MCGIFGIVSKKGFSIKNSLLKGLKRLEYRGYDSCGYACLGGEVVKAIGEINGLAKKAKDEKTRLAIAHTRWATHGKVNELNSHPHFNKAKTIFAVHNGIIENYTELRKELEEKGYSFSTETDTEVIPVYLDYLLNDLKLKEKAAMQEIINRLKGTFAILIFIKEKEKLYALKRDSPLVLGIGNGCFYLASDIYAFSNKTNKAIFFDDDEYAIITPEGYEFFDCFSEPVEKKQEHVEYSYSTDEKKHYEHYMLKEIEEQPESSERLISSFLSVQKPKLKEFSELIRKCKKVVFLACGTSYHAGLIGSYLLTKLGFDARAVIASEFENFLHVDSDTLVIAISQSGETMDVVSVLKDIKLKNAKIAAIVNVPYSTVQRLSDCHLETLAGQEICVAATKTFTNQLIAIFAIAKELGLGSIMLEKIPEKILGTIKGNKEKAKSLAEKIYKKKDIFVLGKAVSYPVAREIALKLKEIPYVHAEGMMAGELKHGTIALIEPGIPVISLIANNNKEIEASTKETEARGAYCIVISNTGSGYFNVPESTEDEFAIYSSIVGHLLSYYIAKLRKLPIDKPRNLAKSVTVK